MIMVVKPCVGVSWSYLYPGQRLSSMFGGVALPKLSGRFVVFV